MSKSERPFVDSAMTAIDLVQKLRQSVSVLGGSDDDLRRVISDETLRGKLASLIMSGKLLPGYLVKVNPGLGHKGLLKAVAADWSNEDITNPKWNPPKLSGRAPYESTVVLLPLGKDMTGAEMDVFVEAEGYRYALPEETYALGAQHRDLQRENPIVCRGAFWVDPDGDPRALVLLEDSGERLVNLDWGDPERRWDAHCRVAVVRK